MRYFGKALLIVTLLVTWISTGLAATVTFGWDPNSETDLAGYRLYYSPTDGPPYVGVGAIEGPSPVEIPLSALADISDPEFSLTGLPYCGHYYFVLTAFNTAGDESGFSNEVDTIMVPTPQDISVVPGLQEGVLSVSWNLQHPGNIGSLAEYRVYYDTDSGAPYSGTGAAEGDSPITIPANEISVQLTELTGGTTMYVAVEAVCLDGSSEMSIEASGVVAQPECDNGVIEAGETCDPIDSCPMDCDDGSACTDDTLLGDPADCTATCDHTPVMNCISGDGCCPEVCDNNNDSDCSVSCGNDVIEAGETCDPPDSCPTECNDGINCTADSLIGSAANCSATCSFNPINDCIAGDGCCPPSCHSTNDADCSSSCGNGVVEAGETCDPPDSCPTQCEDGLACTNDVLIGSAANCSVSCSHTIITACADGDLCCPAGCDSTVDDDCSVTCGNNIIETGETCDPPGNCPATCDDLVACTMDTMTGSAENCSASCSFTVITACDSGDGCCPPGCDSGTDSDCSATCGDGILDPGETCDPINTCPTDCNDGNVCTKGLFSGSASNCSAACTYSPITECIPGDGCCPPGCRSSTDGDCDPNEDLPDPGKPGSGGSASGNTLLGGCSMGPAVGDDTLAGPLLFLLMFILARRRRRN